MLLQSTVVSGCALIAGLDDRGSEPDPVKPTARGSSDPGATSPPSANACGDTVQSASNCGFCGHACGEGVACAQGLCIPTPIALATGVNGLAVDATMLFYTTTSEVRSARAVPDALSTNVLDADDAADAVNGPTKPLSLLGLTLLDDRVYAVDGTWKRVFSCPKTGCEDDEMASVKMDATASPNGTVAVLDSKVLWGEARGIGVADRPKRGERVDAFYPPTGEAPMRIYMSRFGGLLQGLWLTAGGIEASATVGVPSVSIMKSTGIVDFAVDPENAWAITGSTVLRLPAGSFRSETLMTIPGVELLRVLADANGVYALGLRTEDKMQIVYRVRQGRVDPIAMGRAIQINAIALGERHVFYADGKSIVRVAR